MEHDPLPPSITCISEQKTEGLVFKEDIIAAGLVIVTVSIASGSTRLFVSKCRRLVMKMQLNRIEVAGLV